MADGLTIGPGKASPLPLRLHVKICSARRAGRLASHPVVYVSATFDGEERRTNTVRRNSADRPLWNQTIEFASRDDFGSGLLHMALCASKSDGYVLGKCTLELPKEKNELIDAWCSLTNEVNERTGGEIHVCAQFEDAPLPSARRPSDLGAAAAASIRGGTQMLSAAAAQIPSALSRISRHLSSSALSPPKVGSKAKSSDALEAASPQLPQPPSRPQGSFAGRAGAVTLNEIIESLDRLKSVVYFVKGLEATSPTTPPSGENRRADLIAAKRELEDLSLQIEGVPHLGEWKEKLLGLVEDYKSDCITYMTREAWDNVNSRAKSTRQPPPLPNKEERIRARSMARATTSPAVVSTVEHVVVSAKPSPQAARSMVRSATSPAPAPASIITKPAAVKVSAPGTPTDLRDPVTSPILLSAPQTPPPQGASPSQRAATPSGQPSLARLTSRPSAAVIARPHCLSSLEDFDQLCDQGFVVELQETPTAAQTKLCRPLRKGDSVELEYTLFVWDSTCTTMYSFASNVKEAASKPTVVRVGYRVPVALPMGMGHALASKKELASGVRGLATMGSKMAYGSSGTTEVPPNSIVVVEFRVLKVIPAPVATPESKAASGRPPTPQPAIRRTLPELPGAVAPYDVDDDDPPEFESEEHAVVFPARAPAVVLTDFKAREADRMREDQELLEKLRAQHI